MKSTFTDPRQRQETRNWTHLEDRSISRKGGARRRLLGERSALVALREDARVISTDATRLAVLIDSDNTTAGLATELLEEIAKHGTPTIKRAYGDWTIPQLAGWKEQRLRPPTGHRDGLPSLVAAVR